MPDDGLFVSLKHTMKNTLIGILVVVIALLAWFVIAPPTFIQNLTGQATTTPVVVGGETVDETPDTTGGDGLTRTGGNDNSRALAARVEIDAPGFGDPVFKNFTVTGKAPGPWFFEASFPIEIRNAAGAVVATGHATALTDWMTTDDVAFKAEITVTTYTGPATLVLLRDNASGLPEHAGSVSMPITIQAQ